MSVLFSFRFKKFAEIHILMSFKQASTGSNVLFSKCLRGMGVICIKMKRHSIVKSKGSIKKKRVGANMESWVKWAADDTDEPQFRDNLI